MSHRHTRHHFHFDTANECIGHSIQSGRFEIAIAIQVEARLRNASPLLEAPFSPFSSIPFHSFSSFFIRLSGHEHGAKQRATPVAIGRDASGDWRPTASSLVDARTVVDCRLSLLVRGCPTSGRDRETRESFLNCISIVCDIGNRI